MTKQRRAIIMKLKRKYIKFILILMILIAFTLWQNNDLVVTRYAYKNNKIPACFLGYRIVQISDLHNKEFGYKQKRLLDKISSQNPDIIVVTGDVIDSNHTNEDKAMDFINGAVEIAPVYYVNGNHEFWYEGYEAFEEKMKKSGVIIMNDFVMDIVSESGETIKLIGLDDASIYDDTIQELKQGIPENIFTILLSHQPELFEKYCFNEVDLVFSGHAHGGQFRLPFIGGLYAPNQGFFPEYAGGFYTKERTSMVVSRGLGNSVIPMRIFNRPEIVIVDLE
jgi:uncharacterized protein